MIYLVTLLSAVLLTISLIPVFSRLAIRCNVVDMPAARKIHTSPVPRIGGIAMALGTFMPLVIWNMTDGFVRAYLCGAGVLIAFGLLDDLYDLSPKIKFLGQFLAAAIAVGPGGVVITRLGELLPEGIALPVWLAVPLTVIAIVGVTNAINLADGLDGLAGGLSLLIFSGLAYLAWLEGDGTIGIIALALAGALFGFLRFNTHPASVFMGDAGSQFLGFSAVTLSLNLTQLRETTISPLVPLLLLGFPVLDTLTVMATRLAQGRPVFSADRNHFHHHLLGLGFRHPESVLIIYLCQTLLVLAAVRLRHHSDWLLLGGYLIFCALTLAVFNVARSTGWRPGRLELFDVRVAGWLRKLRRDGVVVRYSFPLFERAIPLLFLFTSLVAEDGTPHVRIGAATLAGAVATTRFVAPHRLAGVLRVALYLAIPYAVYLGSVHPPAWLGGSLAIAYHWSFGVLALFIILISKFSRRREGFKSTPLDFLIVFLALAIPLLAGRELQEFRLGLMAAKIIMLYFSFEVLLAELRGKFDRVTLATFGALAALAI